MIYENRENIYEISGDVVYVYRKNGDYLFCADAEDIPPFDMWSWHMNSKGYVVGGISESGAPMQLHKIICPCEKGMTVDHISRDKRDNRKSNLRVCGYVTNNQNRGDFKNNTSGEKGVFWDAYNQRWRAVIGVNGKNKYLGSYLEFEQAKAARKAAEKALHWGETT